MKTLLPFNYFTGQEFGPLSGFGPLEFSAWGVNPGALSGMAARYDASSVNNLTVDSSNRVSLWADSSGNSGTNVLCLNGVAGNYASTPSAAPLNLTSRVCLIAQVALNNWANGGEQVLVAKYDTGTNQRSYAVGLTGTGTLRFYSSTAGLVGLTFDSTVAPATTAFGALWVAVDAVPAGVATFYTSTDGTNWTQLGATVSTATLTTIFSGTAALSVGGILNNGTLALPSAGVFYRAQVLSQLSGTILFDANFALPAKLATSFTESSTNAATVTINTSGDTGARISGDRDLYQGTVSKQPVYLPWVGMNYGYTGAQPSMFYTPSSASLQAGTAATMEGIMRCALPSWAAPASETELFCKYDYPNAAREWSFGYTGSGARLTFRVSQDGSATSNAVSSVDPAFASGAFGWVRFVYTRDTGGGNYSVLFYTAPDAGNNVVPSTWTQLGTTRTGTSITGCFVGTGPLTIGGIGNTTTNVTAAGCKYTYAQLIIAGVTVSIYDSTRYSSGTTFLASTGETWNLLGGATIVTRTEVYGDGVDDYMKTASFSLSQPETVYFVGQQVSWTSNDKFYDGNGVGQQTPLGQVSGGASPQLEIFAGSALGPNSNLPLQLGGVVTAIFNAGASGLRVNRLATLAGAVGAQNSSGFTVFSKYDGSAPGNVTASELILYATAQDAGTQNQVILYEGQKWSISV